MCAFNLLTNASHCQSPSTHFTIIVALCCCTYFIFCSLVAIPFKYKHTHTKKCSLHFPSVFTHISHCIAAQHVCLTGRSSQSTSHPFNIPLRLVPWQFIDFLPLSPLYSLFDYTPQSTFYSSVCVLQYRRHPQLISNMGTRSHSYCLFRYFRRKHRRRPIRVTLTPSMDRAIGPASCRTIHLPGQSSVAVFSFKRLSVQGLLYSSTRI